MTMPYGITGRHSLSPSLVNAYVRMPEISVRKEGKTAPRTGARLCPAANPTHTPNVVNAVRNAMAPSSFTLRWARTNASDASALRMTIARTVGKKTEVMIVSISAVVTCALLSRVWLRRGRVRCVACTRRVLLRSLALRPRSGRLCPPVCGERLRGLRDTFPDSGVSGRALGLVGVMVVAVALALAVGYWVGVVVLVVVLVRCRTPASRVPRQRSVRSSGASMVGACGHCS